MIKEEKGFELYFSLFMCRYSLTDGMPCPTIINKSLILAHVAAKTEHDVEKSGGNYGKMMVILTPALR